MKYRDYNEQKQHGTKDFPIEYYYVDEKHPRYEMPLHWHKEFEIVRILSGGFKLYLNGIEHLLKSGDIITVNCGTLHRGVPQSAVYECIVCDLNMLRRLNGDTAGDLIQPIINGTTAIDCLLEQDNSRLYSLASELFGVMRSADRFYELEVTGLLFGLFNLFYRESLVVSATGRGTPDAHTGMMTDLTEWIEENLHEHISLSQLSGKAGLNEKYFCRVFKEFTGRTPVDYINLLRIERACRLMSHDKLSVTEAAISSGFNDMSYFSKVFKKYKSVSPSDWRKLF